MASLLVSHISNERNTDLPGLKLAQGASAGQGSASFVQKTIKELAKKFIAPGSSCLVFTEREISQLKLVSNSKLSPDYRFTYFPPIILHIIACLNLVFLYFKAFSLYPTVFL